MTVNEDEHKLPELVLLLPQILAEIPTAPVSIQSVPAPVYRYRPEFLHWRNT